MKKLFAFLLLVSLTLSLALPAVALDPTDDLIVDETGSISRHDLGSLNDLALTASEKCGIEIMFLLTDKADGNEIADYAEEAPMGGSGHSVLLAVNETFWYIRSRGDAAVITDDEEEILFEKFADGSGYVDGIEEYIAEAEDYFVQLHKSDAADSTEADAAGNESAETQPPRLVDDAGLLSGSEKRTLTAKLGEISSRQKLDVVIVTENGLGGKSIRDFADDYFDYNGYGYGKGKDGILLLVDMDSRNYWMSTRGYAIDVFTDARIDYIGGCFKDDLSAKNYFDAFDTFADKCEEFINRANDSEPYDTGTLPRAPLSKIWILLSIIIGFIIASIIVGGMKRKLKTVRPQNSANSYLKEGSLDLTESSDLFLYNTVTRTEIPKDDDSSSGGSSTHTSSSGSTHGGGGGSF